MKNQCVIIGALAFGLSSTQLFSQENKEKREKLNEVVVTATKFKTEKKNLGKIVYKLTSKQIKERQGKSLVQLLNDIPGIEINGAQSNRGQNLGMFIRGGRNKQVAILINGVNVNDPSSIVGDFDLRQIDMNQIESIEVLKGASSVLYGTGAAAGVINIILKKASDKEFGMVFTASTGSNRSAEQGKIAFDEREANYNFNGTLGKIDYVLSLNSNSSSGISALESADANNPFNEDTFYRQNVLLQVGYRASKNLRFGIDGSYNKFSTEFDGFNFNPVTFVSTPADQDNNSQSIQNRIGFTTDFSYAKGELKFNTFYTEIDRMSNSTSESLFRGETYGFDIYNNYKVSNKISFLVGLTAQYQDMFQKTSFSNIEEGTAKQHFYDPYVSVNYFSGSGLNLSVGSRVNIHNEYGSNFIYNFNPSYNLTVFNDRNLKVFSSYGTAFITPTLVEIFNRAPTVDQLKPESNTTIEGGFDLEILDNLTINTTYFYREETDKVVWNAGTYSNNIGTFNLKGIESEIVFLPTEKITVSFDYTFLNVEGAVSLIRLPKHKFGLRFNYQLSSSTFASSNYRFTGEREDFGTTLTSYSLVDLFINHKILNDKLTLFGSITNVLNDNYQELNNYTARGRNFKLGLRLQF